MIQEIEDMKIRAKFWLIGLVLMSACTAALADGAVSVKDAYVRAVPPGQPNSASFMMLNNSSDQDRALVAAKSPAAKVVELHTHTMVDGMMQMRQVPQIDLPAGKMVELKPGGLHVMMIGLTQDLKPGSSVPVTLTFDDGSETTIEAPVKKVQMKMMKGGMKHNMNH
jgi:copper(I)-binding protein